MNNNHTFATAPGSASLNTANTGVGPLLDVVADLSVKDGYDANSWWISGNFVSEGHELSCLYNLVLLSGPGDHRTIVSLLSISDATTGEYWCDSQVFPLSQTTVSPEGLDIVTPSGSFRGTFDDLHVVASMDSGTFDLHLRAAAPAILNGGTGVFPLHDLLIQEYSVPLMATEGTLTANGATYQVQGNTWFDRQWMNQDTGRAYVWIWFGINLEGDNALSVWSADDPKITEQRMFATILHGDGTQTVAAAQVTPVAGSDWKSPKTGISYPTAWTIVVPQLDTTLTIDASPKDQELISSSPALGGTYEGSSIVTGTFRGQPIRGIARFELAGWKE